MYDELTGLYNYRYFCQSIERELNLAIRLKDSLVLILLDIDIFKKINDTHGHEIGNLIIKQIAQIIKKNVRDCDYACRYGGDEFAIILTHTEIEAGIQVAERIKHEINNYNFAIENVTTSMGIAAFPVHSLKKGDLFTNADRALYMSKLEGRNRVTVFTEKIKSSN